MKIREELCSGCDECVFTCPVQAIKLLDDKAVIDRELCVECSTCLRFAECPNDAIDSEALTWPRLVRNPFSDVIASHKLTGVPGRGTEEMKTNDVTDRYGLNEIGFSIEVGRPGIGTRLDNIELFTTRLSAIGVEYENNSPLTALFTDDQGHIKKEIKNERVLSAIIEFKVPTEKTPQVLQVVKEVDKIIDTVFTVGLVSRFQNDGTLPVLDLLAQQDFSIRPNAKINVGLGKKEVKEF